MICKKCGTENSEENQFCSKCGNNLKVKKKIINNIFPLLALVCCIICLFLNSSFVLVLMIISFILSILGIVKSSKLKKEIGKRKGIILSIFVLIITFVLLLLSLVYTLFANDINFSPEEKIVGQYIKTIKNSLNDIESFRLNNAILYTQNSNEPTSFCAIIDFSGKNAVGGTGREFLILTYSYRNSYSSVGHYDSLEQAQKIANSRFPSSMSTIKKLDIKLLLKYANDESTPMLEVNYDNEEVKNHLMDAINVLTK